MSAARCVSDAQAVVAALTRYHRKAQREAAQHRQHCLRCAADGRSCCPRGRALEEVADQAWRELTLG